MKYDWRGSITSDISKYGKILGIVAVAILIASGAVLAYNISQKSGLDTDMFLVNDKTYGWDATFEEFEVETLEDADGTPWTGVRLADLVTDSGVVNPEDHEYKIVGSDGYAKTVGWSDMESGLLTKEEKCAFFPGLPKAYHVRDLVEIEVI